MPDLPVVERRTVPLRNASARAAAADTNSAGTIAGTAIVYESISEDLGGWRELIRAGAATEVLASNPDVRMPFLDHSDLPVGRTTAGTLRLVETPDGVDFECDLPDTERGRELYAAVERGDVNQCSFRFVVNYEDREWVYPDGEELPIRTVMRIAELYDVCLVTYPAYSATSASARSAEAETVEIPPNPAAIARLRQRRLALRDRA